MAVPLLGLVPLIIDLVIVAALLVAVVALAGMVKDFLVEHMVDILVDVPRFDYSFEGGRESGNLLFAEYKRQRDLAVPPLVLAGAAAWLATGRFGHRVRAVLQSETVRPVADGVHEIMRPQHAGAERGESAPYASAAFGSDPGMRGWFGRWVAGLPSRCLLCILVVFLMPPLWDAATDGSGRAASAILNPAYSGDPDYPCPREWYVGGRLDTSHPDLLAHHDSVLYLLMQDKTGRLDAMCRPELRVGFMLEQWGGQTKAIPPPLDGSGSLWEMLASMGENAAGWMMRGVGEFFVNILLGVIKAQAVLLSGTAMLVSNMVVDIGVAAMIVFVPVYSALMIMPWDHMGGGRVAAAIRTYGPASLAAAVVYPMEAAALFAVSSEMMIQMLLSEYGSDLLVVWLFGTTVMSMVVAVPVVSLGAFAQVTGQVTGKFTAMIQMAQGGLGAAAGGLGVGAGGVPGGQAGANGGSGRAAGAAAPKGGPRGGTKDGG